MLIIDNFLPPDDFDHFKSVVYGDFFPWSMDQGIASEDDGAVYFTHHFYDNDQAYSHEFQLLNPFLSYAGVKKLLRAKMNCYVKTPAVEKHGMHVDQDFEHKGMIFYVNTNNGVTTLDNGEEVESVANRLMLFDSSKPHCSSSCSDESVRITLNFNYL